MLIKLLPEQVAKHWGELRGVIQASLPPFVTQDQEAMTGILNSLLQGGLEAWLITDGGSKIHGVLTTGVTQDSFSGYQNLLIYSLFVGGGLSKAAWESGWETLQKYASHRGCKLITAYALDPAVVRLAKKLGFNADFTLLKKEV